MSTGLSGVTAKVESRYCREGAMGGSESYARYSRVGGGGGGDGSPRSEYESD